MRKMTPTTDDLGSALHFFVALQDGDVKALYGALEDASFIQETERITAAGVDVKSRENKEDLEIPISLESADDQPEGRILTRYEPDTVATLGGSFWLEFGGSCALCDPVHVTK